jgi:putative ABC transport system ATP-binding protein
MSAFENVELPMMLLGKLSKKERHARALELLNLVGLQDRMSHLPSELSGGEQQRVCVNSLKLN